MRQTLRQCYREGGIRLLLSRLVPMRFRTEYGVFVNERSSLDRIQGPDYQERATWWQWRHRVYRRRTIRVA